MSFQAPADGNGPAEESADVNGAAEQPSDANGAAADGSEATPISLVCMPLPFNKAVDCVFLHLASNLILFQDAGSGSANVGAEEADGSTMTVKLLFPITLTRNMASFCARIK